MRQVEDREIKPHVRMDRTFSLVVPWKKYDTSFDVSSFDPSTSPSITDTPVPSVRMFKTLCYPDFSSLFGAKNKNYICKINKKISNAIITIRLLKIIYKEKS